MNNYEEIVFTIEDFGEDLWSEVAEFLRIATRAGYTCEVYEDDFDIIVVRYNYEKSKEFGNPTIEWVTPAELVVLDNYRNEELEEDSEKCEEFMF